MSLLDSADPVWYPYWGSWLIGLVGEILLTTLSIIYHRPENALDFFRSGAVAFRMCFLLSVLLVLFGGRCTRRRHNYADEENQPLLASSRVQGSSDDSGATPGSAQYGSISTGGSGTPPVTNTGAIDWEAKDMERERKARKRVEDRLRDNGNWWTYAKGFSVSFVSDLSVN